jgi:putative ABC transport system permease protein
MSTHDEAYRDFEIVGVVADVRSNGPAEPAPPMLYVPYQGSPRGTTGLYVRVTSGDPIAVLDPVREAIWSVDASQPITRIRPMSALVGARVAIPRAARSLVAALATLALALAAVGVFGVVAYGVRTRRAELAVRLALGASPERIRRDAMMGAVPLIVLGVGSGLVGGILAARGARALLYGLDPLDPVAAGLALAAMAGIALLATWLPARRVATIDAMEAMRD